MLTLDCSNNTVAIFDQLFEEFARPLQLQFITLEGFSEVWAVLVAVTELQRRVPHLLDELLPDNRGTAGDRCGDALLPLLAYGTLLISAQPKRL